MNKEKKDNKPITIDIAQLFKIDPEKMKLDIGHIHYSNVAYIQVNPRDVQLDFLQMPGIPSSDGTVVKTSRIYLSHSAAKRLAETILSTLKTASDSGGIEQIQLKE